MRFTMPCNNRCGRQVTVSEDTFNRLKVGEEVTVICCICTINMLPNCPEMLDLWIHMKTPKWRM